jgi:hypothetical protein
MTPHTPSLTQSLQGRDLGFLRIVAELWGLELNAPDARHALQSLVAALPDPGLVEEALELLPAEAQAALDELLRNDGRLSWVQFTRRFGAVREMGPGRRDREGPYRNPASPAEALWYRALVCRAFFEAPDGPQEFAFIPSDLMERLPRPGDRTALPLGRPASPDERAQPIPATDRILDDACTLLAALRLELPLASLNFPTASPVPYPLSPQALQEILAAAGLLDDSGLPQPEAARAFLEASRGEALAQLARAWLGSETCNDLRRVPGLLFEGEWENDPLRSRRAVLEYLSGLPINTWWSLEAFIAAVKKRYPDYQRPAGDYDSWFIRQAASGDYLRGFDHWEAVDGALIRYLISGPLYWLGICYLCAPAAPESPATAGSATAFRFTDWAAALLKGEAPEGLAVEDALLVARSNAHLHVPRLTARAARYQIARFASWEDAPSPGRPDETYRYRLTPASLERARTQGLRVAHLLALLRRYAAAVPPSLVKALERWEERGSEARLERATILRLGSAELLQALRASSAARFLGDPLSPTTVIVKSGAEEKVLAALAEMGYLGEGELI